jgi:hypothetical protein
MGPQLSKCPPFPIPTLPDIHLKVTLIVDINCRRCGAYERERKRGEGVETEIETIEIETAPPTRKSKAKEKDLPDR